MALKPFHKGKPARVDAPFSTIVAICGIPVG
jgi:hypothetical protein